MNPADRLIVALDVPVDDASDLVRKLRYQVNNFKLGVGTFLLPHGRDFASSLVYEGAVLMLDLKLYDTRDTVLRTMEAVAKLGAAMVTVHVACTEHALGFGPKVLAVGHLTDGTGVVRGDSDYIVSTILPFADGAVCSAWQASALRPKTGKILACPGVRPLGTLADNHVTPATPRDAARFGADYIIIGRPIYAAPDPVAAARAITREIKEALAGCGR
jgi:orotidine-5'-phosphate decarboxylase